MKKNILFLHLESISRANLWQFRNELGTVWRLMSNSMQFSRFITSSTSTTMTMNDVLFGDSSTKDECTSYAASRSKSAESRFSSLFVRYEGFNYRGLDFHSSQYSRPVHIVTDSGCSIFTPDIPLLCQSALEQFAESKRRNRPFFAYFWDASSHLAYASPLKDNPDSLMDRLRIAYSLIDSSLNHLLTKMGEMGIWDDTIIIGFGDHGDEAWSHEFNKGYCHSITPYASVTWTPMFIYDPQRLPPGITNQLASSIDLKKTILNYTHPGYKDTVPDSPFSGIDLFNATRKVAFSQNMFCLQKELSDPEQGMVKGYAAADEDYRLLITSNAGNPDGGGLELYHDQSDPSNSLNLLKFFKMGRTGELGRFSPPADAVGKHFAATFREKAVDEIRAAYARLRPQLLEYIKAKEANALRVYEHMLSCDAATLAREFWRENSMPSSPEEYIEGMKAKMAAVQPQCFPESVFSKVRKIS